MGNADEAPVYKIAEIVDVVNYPKSYTLDNIITNVFKLYLLPLFFSLLILSTTIQKAFVLRQGKSKRTFRMEYCSNSLFSKEEFKT